MSAQTTVALMLLAAAAVGLALMWLAAEPGANVVGHTAGLLLEVDEAQDVDVETFDRAFRPMAASTLARDPTRVTSLRARVMPV